METGKRLSNGALLNVDKPAGPTSYDVIRILKPILTERKIGHCGTLDPLAEGVLLVVLGEATKLSEAVMNLPKIYWCCLRLGKRTDTGDLQGKVIQEYKESLTITQHQMESTISNFIGEIEQKSPLYSALKYRGKRLCDLARQGIMVNPPVRRVHIERIDLLNFSPPIVQLRVFCSRGTYIRSLAEALGEQLGCGAVVEAMAREAIGPFTREGSHSLQKLRQQSPETIRNFLLTLPQVIPLLGNNSSAGIKSGGKGKVNIG